MQRTFSDLILIFFISELCSFIRITTGVVVVILSFSNTFYFKREHQFRQMGVMK